MSLNEREMEAANAIGNSLGYHGTGYLDNFRISREEQTCLVVDVFPSVYEGARVRERVREAEEMLAMYS